MTAWRPTVSWLFPSLSLCLSLSPHPHHIHGQQPQQHQPRTASAVGLWTTYAAISTLCRTTHDDGALYVICYVVQPHNAPTIQHWTYMPEWKTRDLTVDRIVATAENCLVQKFFSSPTIHLKPLWWRDSILLHDLLWQNGHVAKENYYVIDWFGAKILDRESHRKTRQLRESIHTCKGGQPCMNRDGEANLPTTYDRILVTCSSSTSRDYMPDEVPPLANETSLLVTDFAYGYVLYERNHS